jgi:hypothetical protein
MTFAFVLWLLDNYFGCFDLAEIRSNIPAAIITLTISGSTSPGVRHEMSAQIKRKHPKNSFRIFTNDEKWSWRAHFQLTDSTT